MKTMTMKLSQKVKCLLPSLLNPLCSLEIGREGVPGYDVLIVSQAVGLHQRACLSKTGKGVSKVLRMAKWSAV